MWHLYNSWLIKVNHLLHRISSSFLTYQNQWLNLVLFTIILLFLPHLLSLIYFILKVFYHLFCFFYYLGKYLLLLLKKIFNP
ncbi:hypothetical protein B2G44_00390 [Candidatus Phytoplasma citri]|uniref:Uncharacterized protein n=1 Tax=Candidatus Phytoplasma citri TaxID=180978 RepID=A0A1S9M440_9MOLU|nr:hypothetical protein B2G44_00390 [Candidatus Phytoplasma aurantifolia]